MSDQPPPPPIAPDDGPPPVPQDGLGDLGFESGGVAALPPFRQDLPAYGEAPPERIAHPALRALAFALDGLGTIILTTVIVFGSLIAGGFEGFSAIWVLPLASAVLATVLTATIGVTPAKALVGLRVVHVETGRPIGAWAIVRSLVIVAPIVLSGIGFSLLGRIPYVDYAVSDALSTLYFFGPILGWIALLVVLIVRPRHRGLQDLASRSIVVRR